MNSPTLFHRCLILLLLGGLVSCSPPVTFDEPQPAGVTPIAEFPHALLGMYISLHDSAILTVGEQFVSRAYDFPLKISKKESDTLYLHKGDTLIDPGNNRRIHVVLKGDTVYGTLHYCDTLFRVCENGVLKKFKGHYFLSSKSGEGWFVQKLTCSGDVISLSEIAVKADIQKLKDITHAPADSIQYHFNPSKREFKKFLKEDGFSESEEYLRITSDKLPPAIFRSFFRKKST
jgi:hypothetical protein